MAPIRKIHKGSAKKLECEDSLIIQWPQSHPLPPHKVSHPSPDRPIPPNEPSPRPSCRSSRPRLLSQLAQGILQQAQRYSSICASHSAHRPPRSGGAISHGHRRQPSWSSRGRSPPLTGAINRSRTTLQECSEAGFVRPRFSPGPQKTSRKPGTGCRSRTPHNKAP